ncbi:MAG TPA: hypothetical protein VGV86_05680 [Acidimicrobiales bacterium]|nr:hypothetical protein [Acidimicrobiales bacterium]
MEGRVLVMAAGTVRRVVGAVAIAVASAVSVGFTMHALTTDVSEPTGIACYASADLRAGTAVVGADGRSPVEVCGEVWKRGDIGSGPVPSLAACVLPSGAAGVFPGGRETCAALDLAPLDEAAYRAGTGDFIALRTALVDRFLASGCLDRPGATRVVEDELRAHGLASWRIVNPTGFTADRPCASLAFEPAATTVLLVPVPRGG